MYIGLVRDTQCVVHISTDTIETPTAKEFKAKVMKNCAAMVSNLFKYLVIPTAHQVRSDPFTAVVGSALCRINNSLDASRRPFPPSVIVERAINKAIWDWIYLVHAIVFSSEPGDITLCATIANILPSGADMPSVKVTRFIPILSWTINKSCFHFQSLLGQAGAVGLASLMATASVPYSLAIGTFGFAIMKVGQAVSRRYIMRSIIWFVTLSNLSDSLFYCQIHVQNIVSNKANKTKLYQLMSSFKLYFLRNWLKSLKQRRRSWSRKTGKSW